MSNNYELFAENQFKYTFNNPVAINDLILALEGYKGLVSSYLPAVLSKIVGVKVDRVEIFITEIEQGSIIEKFIIKAVFGDEKTAMDFADKLGEITGCKNIRDGKIMSGAFKIIVCSSITAMLVVGAMQLLPSNKAELANNINIVNIGQTSLTGEEIYNVVDTVLNSPARKKKTQIEVQKILSPIHSNGGEIEMNGNPSVIPASVFEAIPRGIINDEPNQIMNDHDDIDLSIRASDRDKTSGWAVVIDQLVPTRKTLEFEDPNIDLSRLANNATVRANVTIVKKLDGKGRNYIVDKVILRSFVDEDIE